MFLGVLGVLTSLPNIVKSILVFDVNLTVYFVSKLNKVTKRKSFFA